MKVIDNFSGYYSFLSNFHRSILGYEGITYPSVEHAFQAAKTLNPDIRWMISRFKNPGDAKRAGRRLDLRVDWEEKKIGIMTDLIRLKFLNQHLRDMLLETEDATLIEGNWWGDRFWGVDNKTGEGENNLGKILMFVRRDN